MGVVTYMLADKDDVTLVVPPVAIKPGAALDLQQASAAKQRMIFLTEKSFEPVKLIVNCDGCVSKFEAFRIALGR